MKVVLFLLFFVTFIIVAFLTELVEGNKYETQLLNDILKNYDRRTRPVVDYHSPVIVNFSINIQQILRVNEKHQVIKTNIWRSMLWNDNFLKWNPENYGNISDISIHPGQIWIPDIQIYNLVSYDKQVESYTSNFLDKDGYVMDVLPMVVTTTCKIDVTWFPFDEQKCFLIFGSWTLSTKYLHLEVSDNIVDTIEAFENGEWKLLGVTAVKNLKTYTCCPDISFMRIVYTINLKRRTFYYFFNLLVPCGLIGFLAVLGFTLPPDSGEKLSLGATILFSLIVFLNMIGETMPANSDEMPLLGTYFNCVMFMIALSVVSTIVINLKLKAVYTKEFGMRSKKVFLYWLPWILRMTPPPNIVCQYDRILLGKKKVGSVTSSDINGQMESMGNFGFSMDKKVKQQWIYIATVVDRLCLIISIIFTFISITVFLIYAF